MVRLDPRRWFAGLRTLDPNVRSLGIVSFFADLSSEIAYPLFPIFVTSVLGVPVALLGVIEGIAEATASIAKYPFGQAAAYTGPRRPLALARPRSRRPPRTGPRRSSGAGRGGPSPDAISRAAPGR